MYQRSSSLVVVATASLLMMSTAQAVPISGLFATGVDGSGVALGDGAIDSHYSIVSPAQNALVIDQASIPATWFPNSTTSRWVWETNNGQPVNVTRTFETVFDLSGLDPTTASITGSWATDNFGQDILVNGTSTGNTCSGFSALCDFTITSGFNLGLNTLSFQVEDIGFIGGILVSELSGTADELAVPEPTTLTLLGVGLFGLGVAARRRKSRSSL